MQTSTYDVVIIGAGAAGLMCAITAGRRGRQVIILDHAQKIGEKIRISGGGRCNFTNLHTDAAHYLSVNPHFCKSALSRFTPHDFIALVEKHGIAYHEKKLGQLFCDNTSQQIIDMLVAECRDVSAHISTDTTIEDIKYDTPLYYIQTSRGLLKARNLVIATGGLSIPKIGATNFGYKIARQFNIPVTETRAGLVPLTFQSDILDLCKSLSGISGDAAVTCDGITFTEGLLFTHRGLSGPSILQISSYWREGMDIIINLAPAIDVAAFLKNRKTDTPRQDICTILGTILPTRLAEALCDINHVRGRIADLSHKTLDGLAQSINQWRIRPGGTEGYRTAEVTLGGVDTNALSSKTMEAKRQPGLFFIGEVVDVTGHLGGFNFQWAWASGHAAGLAV